MPPPNFENEAKKVVEGFDSEWPHENYVKVLESAFKRQHNALCRRILRKIRPYCRKKEDCIHVDCYVRGLVEGMVAK